MSVGKGTTDTRSPRQINEAVTWYLDKLETRWWHVYSNDPCCGELLPLCIYSNAPHSQQSVYISQWMLNHLLGIRDELCPMVLGGEGLMWGETADASNALQMCFFALHKFKFTYRGVVALRQLPRGYDHRVTSTSQSRLSRTGLAYVARGTIWCALLCAARRMQAAALYAVAACYFGVVCLQVQYRPMEEGRRRSQAVAWPNRVSLANV